MADSKVLEIANDSFYVKKNLDCQQCKFAYLHLSEQAHDVYVAFFDNRDAKEPKVYWWEEEDLSINEKTRRIILVFIGEAYLSLYIKAGMERHIDKPLWRHTKGTNCGIPSKWWEVVKNIKRENETNNETNNF